MTDWLRQVPGDTDYDDATALADGFAARDRAKFMMDVFSAQHQQAERDFISFARSGIAALQKGAADLEREAVDGLRQRAEWATSWLSQQIPPALEEPGRPSAFTALGETVQRGLDSPVGQFIGTPAQRGAVRGLANVLTQTGASADEARRMEEEGNVPGAAGNLLAGASNVLNVPSAMVHGAAIESGVSEPAANVVSLLGAAVPATAAERAVGAGVSKAAELAAPVVAPLARAAGRGVQRVGEVLGEGVEALSRAGEAMPEARLAAARSGVAQPQVAAGFVPSSADLPPVAAPERPFLERAVTYATSPQVQVDAVQAARALAEGRPLTTIGTTPFTPGELRGAVAGNLIGGVTGAATAPGDATPDERARRAAGFALAGTFGGANAAKGARLVGEAAREAERLGIVARGGSAGRAGSPAEMAQRVRYFNTLWQVGGALADLISTGINLPGLWATTKLAAAEEARTGVPPAVRATTQHETRGIELGVHTGAMDALRVLGDVMWRGAEPVATEQARLLTKGPAGLVTEFGPRLRVASDTMFQHIGRTVGAHMLAFRQADRMGLEYGTPEYGRVVEAYKDAITARLAKGDVKQGGTALPTPRQVTDVLGTQSRTVRDVSIDDLAAEAEAISKRLIFQQELGSTAKLLGGVRGDRGPLGWLILFYKTGANLGAEGVTAAPVAGEIGRRVDLVRAANAQPLFAERAALRTKLANTTDAALRQPIEARLDEIAREIGRGGPYAGEVGNPLARTNTAAVLPASQRLARQQLGWATMLGSGLMAGAGLITDTGPTNQSEYDRLYETGWRPLAFHVAGHYIPVARVLGPAAVPVAMGAALAGEYRRTGQLDAALVRAVTKGTAQWFDLAGLRSFYDLLDLGYKTRGNPRALLGSLERMAASQVGTVLPGPLRALENLTDPVERDPKGLWQRIAAQLPGAAGLVEPRKTSSGEVVKRSKLQGVSPVPIVEEQPNANKPRTAAQLRAAQLRAAQVGAARRQAPRSSEPESPIAAIVRGVRERFGDFAAPAP